MLLFSDGFESYHIHDLRLKWGWVAWDLYDTIPVIVSGNDPTCNKPYATKDGRALYLGSAKAQLLTSFKPSRTIFTGFAVRSRGTSLTMVLSFHNRMGVDKGKRLGLWNADPLRPVIAVWPNNLATLTLTITQYRVGISWAFTNAPMQVGEINTNANMLSGDYHYIQVGFTLTGNSSAQPQAWAEVRVGSRTNNNCVFQDILTTLPDGAGEFYVSSLSLQTGTGNVGTTLDDCYICNDEGNVNNKFLGNVKVRRALPIADGTENDATPTLHAGDVRRFMAVDEDFIGTVAPLPIPEPTEDPLYIPWVNGLDDYLTLERSGDRQLLRFANVNFSGSKPTIHGAILNVLAKARYRHIAGTTALRGVKKTGLLPVQEAKQADAPLSFYRGQDELLRASDWQSYPLVFENTEVVAPGEQPQIWNPTVVNDSEFGFDLGPCELDPVMYGASLTRFNLIFEQALDEFLWFGDLSHRYYEEPVSDEIDLAEGILYEYTWRIDDSLYWDDELIVTRSFPKFLNDEIIFVEEIPWIYLFAQGLIGFADEVFFQWLDVVEDGFATDDWSDGFWEELFADDIGMEDTTMAPFIEALDEMFGLEEPYLWDGHELVEDEIAIVACEPWDNHELLEETLYPDDELSQGIGLTAEDEVCLTEEHFDGQLVEQPEEYIGMNVSVLTQQWRYERLFGIVLASWQVEPVEQAGAIDGDHTGDNPWGA